MPLLQVLLHCWQNLESKLVDWCFCECTATISMGKVITELNVPDKSSYSHQKDNECRFKVHAQCDD